MTSSSRPGMGAVPYAGGVTFRVWAPFAPSVHVAGDFNRWSLTATPLSSEGNGHWSVDVPGAAPGQKYKLGAEFHHSVRRTLTAARDEDRDMEAVRASIERRLGESAFSRVVYTESHDEVASGNGKRRLPDDIEPGHADGWHARKRSTLGAALALTSPGIPMIFQGQEILEWLPFGENRMDWDKYDRFRVIFTLYRDLIRLRRNWFDNTRDLRGHGVNVFHVNGRDR